jgi:hypothetical protein
MHSCALLLFFSVNAGDGTDACMMHSMILPKERNPITVEEQLRSIDRWVKDLKSGAKRDPTAFKPCLAKFISETEKWTTDKQLRSFLCSFGKHSCPAAMGMHTHPVLGNILHPPAPVVIPNTTKYVTLLPKPVLQPTIFMQQIQQPVQEPQQVE